MSAVAGPPLKHASNTDFTPALFAFTTVILVLSTVAIIARLWSRSLIKAGTDVDDVLAVIGWLGLLANIIANYIMGTANTVSLTPPSAHDAIVSQKAQISVGYSYPTSISASRLSLLFLLRRIFSMRTTWFRVGWMLLLALVSAWLVLAFTFASLSVSGAATIQWQFNYGVPTLAFINAFTDIFMLILPIGMTKGLKLPWRQRAAVTGIFTLGSAGAVTSLIRAVRSIQSKNEHWDPRYHFYSELMLGVAEAGAISICACLPTLRPLFRGLARITKKGLSSFGSSQSKSKRSNRLESGQDDDASIVLKDNVAGIARTVEWNIETISDDDIRSPSHGGGHARV